MLHISLFSQRIGGLLHTSPPAHLTRLPPLPPRALHPPSHAWFWGPGAHGDRVARPRIPGPAVHKDRGDGARSGEEGGGARAARMHELCSQGCVVELAHTSNAHLPQTTPVPLRLSHQPSSPLPTPVAPMPACAWGASCAGRLDAPASPHLSILLMLYPTTPCGRRPPHTPATTLHTCA